LAKAKRAIRKGIADCSNCSVASIGNPIPNIKGAWRAGIEIGFAVPEEHSEQLQFTKRQDMGID
jgi:hypothetical protein